MMLVLRDGARLDETTVTRGSICVQHAKVTWTGAFTFEGYNNVLTGKLDAKGSGLEARLTPLFIPSQHLSPRKHADLFAVSFTAVPGPSCCPLLSPYVLGRRPRCTDAGC